MLLVQFTGAQGTGKTTLVNELRNFYSEQVDTSFIGEISRSYKEAGVISGIDNEATAVDQIKLTSRLLFRYFEEMVKRNVVITFAERSPFCCYGYLHTLNDSLSADFNYAAQQIYDFISLIVDHKQGPELRILTIYVPLGIPFDDDGVRKEDSREVVDKNIQTVLKNSGVNYYTVQSTDLKERVQELIKVIDRNI